MLFKTLSAAVYGIDANIIEVEVDVATIKFGEERFTTVGSLKPPASEKD
jgi:magnesium chelatase family protein